MEGRPIYLAALCMGVFAVGCGKPQDLPFEQFAEPPGTYSPASASDNAYDAYALAAIEVEQTCAKYLHRNYFTPAMKKNCVQLMSGPLSRVQAGTGLKCMFQFRPYQPGERPPYQKGWRLIGRALVWLTEQAILDQDYDVAVSRANQAITFGFDLVGGGALDASLGFTIVDEARRAIAPALARMSPGQLQRLEEGVTRALLNRPLLVQTLDNERQNATLAVQFVQDSYRSGKWTDLQRQLDKDARPAIDYLKQLKEEEPSKRVAYFRDFAAEGKAEMDWIIEQSKLPKYKREERRPQDDPDKERPWRRFARHFFYAGRPLLEVETRTLARTRLLVLHAAAYRQVREEKAAMATIRDFNIMVKTDPYSGRDFIYRSSGADFRVYSVGADCRDDGGDTDEAYSAPDLMLETRG